MQTTPVLEILSYRLAAIHRASLAMRFAPILWQNPG